MVGTMAGGMMSPASMRAVTTDATRSRRRCRTKATIAARTTRTATEPTVRMRLLRMAVTTIPFRAEHLTDVGEEEPLRGQGELETRGLDPVLRRGQHDEDEWHDEHDAGDQQGNDVEPPATDALHSSISRFEKNRIIG